MLFDSRKCKGYAVNKADSSELMPSGETWGCSAACNVVESIVNWISYWDKPRTETGALIKLFKSDMDQSPLKLPLS